MMMTTSMVRWRRHNCTNNRNRKSCVVYLFYLLLLLLCAVCCALRRCFVQCAFMNADRMCRNNGNEFTWWVIWIKMCWHWPFYTHDWSAQAKEKEGERGKKRKRKTGEREQKAMWNWIFSGNWTATAGNELMLGVIMFVVSSTAILNARRRLWSIDTWKKEKFPTNIIYVWSALDEQR